MSEENKALAGRFHMDFVQQGNLAEAEKILSKDIVVHCPGTTAEWGQGPEGVVRDAVAFLAAFPDLRITHDNVIAEGDKVAIRWSLTGTHKNEFVGLAPTGRVITMTGIDIFRITGGKIVELWQNMDQLGVMQQLGIVPAPK